MLHLAFAPPSRLVSSTLPARIVAAAAAALCRVRTRLHRRATARALHNLSDRTLKDIGLDRSEIESIASSVAADRRHARLDPRSRLC